jgi:hypothetical protein
MQVLFQVAGELGDEMIVDEQLPRGAVFAKLKWRAGNRLRDEREDEDFFYGNKTKKVQSRACLFRRC